MFLKLLLVDVYASHPRSQYAAGYTVIVVDNALHDVGYVGMLAGSTRRLSGLAMSGNNVGEDPESLLIAYYFLLGQRKQKRFTDAEGGRPVGIN